ncbi:MAG: zinc-ribbon domain-containing protein [Gammaproteobacteria bacterium]|jgi:hypothetical protein|nr:zinc-ribbon domain-containing protein [Gammaproteobacteria bacterium]
MPTKPGTGRNPSAKQLRAAEHVLNLNPLQRKTHPSAIQADPNKLAHINTYGSLPEYYVDQPFTCRKCGKREIWKATDQKWYYEEARGHIDAKAVECHDCRTKK